MTRYATDAWNPRESLRPVNRALERLNARHPWSHNDHFHRWMLRRLPDRRDAALEVGCGTGELTAALASHFGQVIAVDPSAAMARATSDRVAGLSNVTVREAAFEQVEDRVDLITMIATLHHLDLEAGLSHARELLRPGGRLLVVGLAQPRSVADIVWGIAGAVSNPVIGFVKHPRAVRGARQRPADPFPVADPKESFDQIRTAAGQLLPGSRCHRREGFRYTLEWTAP